MLKKLFLRFLIPVIVAAVISCSSSQKKVMETSSPEVPEPKEVIVETPVTLIPKEEKPKALKAKSRKKMTSKNKRSEKKEISKKEYKKATPKEIYEWDRDVSGTSSHLNGGL